MVLVEVEDVHAKGGRYMVYIEEGWYVWCMETV